MKTRPINLTNDERRMVSEIVDSVLNSTESVREEHRSFIVVRIPVQVLTVEVLKNVQRKFAPVVPVSIPAGQGASESTVVEGE